MRHLFFCLLLMIGAKTAWSQDTTQFLVAPYLQLATQNSMTILWETADSASTIVKFGPAKLKDVTPNLAFTKKVEGLRTMHEVVLNDLTPETVYFWQVNSTNTAGKKYVHKHATFKTAVKDSSAFMFVLLGDSQRNKDTPWAWSVIADQAWKKRPNFVIHAGDLVDWGPKKTDWTEGFFPDGQPLMERVPIYSVLGNHEGDADLYYQYMANPKPEQFYSFEYGNAAFFMIDTNRDVSEGSDQFNWLEQQLAKSTAVWKFAVHHHPPYSSESDDHGNTAFALSSLGTKARNLSPLFEKYGVDFSLFGHTHVYERTWPLKENRINQKEGVVYINSGGAGGFLEDFAPTRSWFTLELQTGHHFCTFAIYDQTLIFKAIDHEGRVFDTFEMTKSKDKSNGVSIVAPPAPIINSEAFVFQGESEVTIDPGLEGLAIHYTLDGKMPKKTDQLYERPFRIDQSLTLKARAFTTSGEGSRIVSKQFLKMRPIPAIQTNTGKRGLKYRYFEGDWRLEKDNYFTATQQKRNGVLRTLNLGELGNIEAPYWGIEIEGYLRVPTTKTYTFYALDSRGLEIKINDEMLFSMKGEKEAVKQVVLGKGFHKIWIQSKQRNSRKSLGFGFYDPILGRIPFKPFQLYYEE